MDARIAQQKQELQNILIGLVKAYSSSSCLSICDIEVNGAEFLPEKPKISKLEILNLLKKIPKFYIFLSEGAMQPRGENHSNREGSSSLFGRSQRKQSDSERIGILICLVTLCFQRWNGHLDLIERAKGTKALLRDEDLQDFLREMFSRLVNADDYTWILLNEYVIDSSNMDSDASVFLTDRDLQPLLGQIIIIMIDELELIGTGLAIDQASHSKGKLLILDCLNSILSAIIFESKAQQSSYQDCILADRMAQFLPGLFSALAKLVLRPKKNINENHKVIMACFHILGLIISASLNDEVCLSFLPDPIEIFIQQKESNDIPKSFKADNNTYSPYNLLTRDEAWLSATSSNLEKIIPSLCSFLSHDLWKVRLAVVRFSFTLLKSCHRTLASSLDLMVQNLLQGLNDDYAYVSEFSNNSINQLCEQCPWFQTALDENLKNVLEKAPYLIRSSDKMKGTLMSLASHFSIIKRNPQNIYSSKIVIEQGLDKLFQGLLYILTPDLQNTKSMIQLQEQFDSLSFLDHSSFSRDKSWKLLCFSKQEFVHFNDYSICENVLSMFSRLIAVYPELVHEKLFNLHDSWSKVRKNSKKAHPLFKNDPDSVQTSIADLDESAKETQILQWFLLLNEFTQSCGRTDLIESVIPLYLSHFENFCTQKSPKLDTISLVQTNLLLQGIANVSAALDSPEKLHYLMMDSLYYVLTLLAHPNYNIKSAAHNALEIMGRADRDMSNHFEQGDLVLCLVSKYSDYLFDKVLEQIRYPTLYPFSPRLVGAIVGVCGSQLIDSTLNPYQVGSGNIVIEVVESVVDVLDSVGSSGKLIGNTGLGSVEEFVGVLCGVLRYCCQGDQAIKSLAEGSNLVIENESTVYRITEVKDPMKNYIKKLLERRKEREEEDKVDPAEFFKEYLEKKEKEKQKVETDVKENIDSLPPEPEIILSKQETVACIVLERAMFLLTSDSVRVRILVLEAVKISIALLAHQSTKLYPLIHTLWPLLLRKCQDPIPSVVIASLEVLQLICQSCRDFVRQRIEKDIIDRILQILTDLQAKACKSYLTKGNKNGPLDLNVNSKKNQIMYFEKSSRTACDLFYSTLSSLQEIVKYIPLKQTQGQKLVLILVAFLNSSLYTPQVILKSTHILQNLVKAGFDDYIWIVLMVVLGGARDSFRRSEIADSQKNKNAKKYWIKSRDMVKVFGKPRDFMESCKELMDMFDMESQKELQSLLAE